MMARLSALGLLAFLSVLASVVSRPVGEAQGQQQPTGKVYRIGFLSQGDPPTKSSRHFSSACRN